MNSNYEKHLQRLSESNLENMEARYRRMADMIEKELDKRASRKYTVEKLLGENHNDYVGSG